MGFWFVMQSQFLCLVSTYFLCWKFCSIKLVVVYNFYIFTDGWKLRWHTFRLLHSSSYQWYTSKAATHSSFLIYITRYLYNNSRPTLSDTLYIMLGLTQWYPMWKQTLAENHVSRTQTTTKPYLIRRLETCSTGMVLTHWLGEWVWWRLHEYDVCFINTTYTKTLWPLLHIKIMANNLTRQILNHTTGFLNYNISQLHQ